MLDGPVLPLAVSMPFVALALVNDVAGSVTSVNVTSVNVTSR